VPKEEGSSFDSNLANRRRRNSLPSVGSASPSSAMTSSVMTSSVTGVTVACGDFSTLLVDGVVLLVVVSVCGELVDGVVSLLFDVAAGGVVNSGDPVGS